MVKTFKTLRVSSYLCIGLMASTLLVSGCSTSGDNYRADVYRSDQVNKEQEVKTVKVVAVMPARVEVDNSEAKKRTQLAAGLLGAVAGGLIGAGADDHATDKAAVGAAVGGVGGAAAGSLVKDKVLVDGVSITYERDGKVYNSAQVGKVCEYAPGTAVVISANGRETRVQPNAVCPTPDK